MELNAEQIIKQMQEWRDNMCENACLKGESLNGRVHTCEICFPNTVKNALALIKELNEDNEAKDETITNLIETIKSIQADTVRKMQERINAHFDSDSDYFRSSHGYIRSVVDQIAKEMLEGKNES